MITNAASGTNVHEIAPGIYRINTPVDIPGGPSFNFNQYLIADDEPLLFHTGPRRMFPLVAEAIGKVLPLPTIRYVAFSHVEADECGALNDFLAAAPGAVPVCGQVAAMVSVNDLADRPARALADGEVLTTGKHALRWFDAPHVPHGWECGFMMETRDAHAALRRPLHAGRQRRHADHRVRHPRAERSVPRPDGLLRARPAHRRGPGAPGARAAAGAGVHARQRLARRRRGAAARPGEDPRREAVGCRGVSVAKGSAGGRPPPASALAHHRETASELRHREQPGRRRSTCRKMPPPRGRTSGAKVPR